MKIVAALSLVLCALLTLTLFTAVRASRALGTPSSVLSAVDGCGLPCWRGIAPRATGLSQAQLTLTRGGFTPHTSRPALGFVSFDGTGAGAGCSAVLGYAAGQVTSLALTECRDVALGDVVALLGEPDGVLAPGTALTFDRGLVIASLPADECRSAFSPLSAVETIYLRAQPPSAARAFPWHGFIDRDRYAALEPEMSPCL